MMRRLAAVVAASLVPLLVLSGTDAANAATNLNVWKTVHVTKGDTLSGIDGVDCTVTSRYAANGYGLEWANSECVGGPDMSPGWSQFGEPGAKVTLVYKGTYDGAAAPANYTESKHNNNLVAFNSGASTCVTKVCTSGKVAWNNVSGGTLSQNMVYSSVCWNGTTVPTASDASWAGWNGGTTSTSGYRDAAGTYTSPWPVGPVNYLNYTCPAGQTLYAVAGGLNAAPTQANIYTITQQLGPGIPQAGEGAGNPCEASSSQMTLADYPGENGWKGIASLIPNGSLTVPSTYGHCIVDKVCVRHHSDGGVGPSGDGTFCGDANFGAPAAVPASGDTSTEPAAPGTTGHDNPDAPTTEPGFWEAILGALAAGFKMLWNVLSGIFSILAGLVSAFSDLFFKLFVPHPSSWDTQGLLDQLNARPPFSVVGDLGTTVKATADGYSDGSGCGSIADFHAPGGGGEITCSSMKSTPGYGTLFTLVQVGLWSMTALAIFNLFAARARSGDGA